MTRNKKQTKNKKQKQAAGQARALQDYRRKKDLAAATTTDLQRICREVKVSEDGTHNELVNRIWAIRKGAGDGKHVNAGTLCPRCGNILRVTFSGPDYRRYTCDKVGCKWSGKLPRE